jgi:hypothetical protein
MPLTKEQITKMCDLVAADADCRTLLTCSASNPLSWVGLAGTAVTAWHMYDDKEEADKHNCVGVANVTVKALNAGKAKVPWLKSVSDAHRSPGGWHHFATRVLLDDGSEWVLDWHKTLNPWNPWVSPRDEWGKGDDKAVAACCWGEKPLPQVTGPKL